MNRTDRLYAIVEELRAVAPRPVSATRMAERFEVSVRTIERDILALQEGGVPVWAERGRNGGYAIDTRSTLPPLNLDADEALAVMIALAAMPPAPFTAPGRR
ncbi:MAG: HTH domain-containing protein [Acidimicrobiia bacterium]|nr:HTH domain-containing protein [Acidimicrobiia bacterium]